MNNAMGRLLSSYAGMLEKKSVMLHLVSVQFISRRCLASPTLCRRKGVQREGFSPLRH